jgi:hypothetical protein
MLLESQYDQCLAALYGRAYEIEWVKCGSRAGFAPFLFLERKQ